MIALIWVSGDTSRNGNAGQSGWVCLAATEKGIAASTLPQATAALAIAEVREALRKGPAHCLGAASTRRPVGDRPDALLRRAARELRQFFAGEKVTLDLPLDLSRVSDFTRRVLLAARGIPYGRTRSYGWVARRAGRPRAARAVGQVMAGNPLAPIVPCHRVIGGDGSMVGYGGGMDYKRYLLDMEGAPPTSKSRRIRSRQETMGEAS